MRRKTFNKSCPICHSRPRKLSMGGKLSKIKYYGCPNFCELKGCKEGWVFGLSNEKAQAEWRQAVKRHYEAYENMKLYHAGDEGEIWLDFDDTWMAKNNYMAQHGIIPGSEDEPDYFEEFTEKEYNNSFNITWRQFKRFFDEPRVFYTQD